MTRGPVRALGAASVGMLAVACSSQVDVGFTNDASDDGGASSVGGDEAAARSGGPPCVAVTTCDAGACALQIYRAPWCTGACFRMSGICGNECVDRSSDPNHCGDCDNVCHGACVGGACVM